MIRRINLRDTRGSMITDIATEERRDLLYPPREEQAQMRVEASRLGSHAVMIPAKGRPRRELQHEAWATRR